MFRTPRELPDLRWLLIPLALALLLILFTPGAHAESDGRINLAADLGGDSLTCVDAGMNPTSDPTNAGIRLLDADGDTRFYVSPRQIAAVLDHPLENTIIAQGNGSSGPVYLERLTTGAFGLIGSDTYGGTFVFTWTGCAPIHDDSTLSAQISAACVDVGGDANAKHCQQIAAELAPVCALENLDAKKCIARHIL